jgi:UDP-N-acetyl-D-mannosaminuronate dehydrogenase
VASLSDALAGAELILLLVDHKPLRQLDPVLVAGLTPARLVVDCVNSWTSSAWTTAGFRLLRLGASTARPLS